MWVIPSALARFRVCSRKSLEVIARAVCTTSKRRKRRAPLVAAPPRSVSVVQILPTGAPYSLLETMVFVLCVKIMTSFRSRFDRWLPWHCVCLAALACCGTCPAAHGAVTKADDHSAGDDLF